MGPTLVEAPGTGYADMPMLLSDSDPDFDSSSDSEEGYESRLRDPPIVSSRRQFGPDSERVPSCFELPSSLISLALAFCSRYFRK